MTKNQGYAAFIAACTLTTAAARADVLHVNFTSTDPTYSTQFGGLSFDIDTGLTVDTLTTGNCGAGNNPGIYEDGQFNGSVSNGILVWDGVTYTLQNSAMYYETLAGACVFYLNISLTFNNNTQFRTQDQGTGGPYEYASYNPSQLLSNALTSGYNNQHVTAAALLVNGQVTGLDAFTVTVTPVP